MNLRPIELNGLTTFITESLVSDKAVKQAIDAYNILTPSEGVLATGIDKSKKDSMDVCISQSNTLLIQKEITDILELYREYYHLKDHVPPMKILEEYNIQKYPLKGAFHKIHCDRGYIPNVNNNRELVFMTYLNDVHTGGETEFMFYNLKIKPQKGLTLVWPAGWTHLHRGLPSPTTEKMIVTGWYSYEQ
jgi:hypothetical protein